MPQRAGSYDSLTMSEIGNYVGPGAVFTGRWVHSTLASGTSHGAMKGNQEMSGQAECRWRALRRCNDAASAHSRTRSAHEQIAAKIEPGHARGDRPASTPDTITEARQMVELARIHVRFGPKHAQALRGASEPGGRAAQENDISSLTSSGMAEGEGDGGDTSS